VLAQNLQMFFSHCVHVQLQELGERNSHCVHVQL